MNNHKRQRRPYPRYRALLIDHLGFQKEIKTSRRTLYVDLPYYEGFHKDGGIVFGILRFINTGFKDEKTNAFIYRQETKPRFVIEQQK